MRTAHSEFDDSKLTFPWFDVKEIASDQFLSHSKWANVNNDSDIPVQWNNITDLRIEVRWKSYLIFDKIVLE